MHKAMCVRQYDGYFTMNTASYFSQAVYQSWAQQLEGSGGPIKSVSDSKGVSGSIAMEPSAQAQYAEHRPVKSNHSAHYMQKVLA